MLKEPLITSRRALYGSGSLSNRTVIHRLQFPVSRHDAHAYNSRIDPDAPWRPASPLTVAQT